MNIRELKKKRKRRLIIVNAAFLVLFMSFAIMSIALADTDYKVDGRIGQDENYALLLEDEEVSIYHADDPLNHYLLVKASDGFKGDITLDDGNGTIYNVGYELDKPEIRSVIVNDSVEMRLKRREFWNKIVLKVNHRTYELELKPDTELGDKPETMSPWTGWSMTIIFGIAWLFSVAVNNVRRKQYIEAYIMKVDKHGHETITDELEIVGEYKGEYNNSERGCIDMEVRDGIKRKIIHSDKNFSEYKQKHCVKSYFVVRYLLGAIVWQERLRSEEEVKLGWSNLANLARGLLFLFGPSLFGVFLSPLAWALILSFTFPMYGGPAILIGALVGEALVIIMYFAQKHDYLTPKRETAKVRVRWFIAPIEASKEMLDVYLVSGKRLKSRVTSDEAVEAQWVDFVNEKVVGYEALYEMMESERTKLNRNEDGTVKVKVVGIKERRRTTAEMQHLKRSWMRRNKQVYQQMYLLRKRIASLQKTNDKLRLDKEDIYEELQAKMRDMMQKMGQQRDARMNTLQKIMEDQFGAIKVKKDLPGAMEDAMRVIRAEEQRAKADQMEELIRGMEALIELMAKKTDLKVERLKMLIEQKQPTEAST